MAETDTQLLYEELVSTGRSQAALHRWKAVYLGAIFSVALGTAAKSKGSSIYALAGIPFLTVYIDFLIRGYDLQIGTLLGFLSKQSGVVADYIRRRESLPLSTGRFSNLATVSSSA